MPHKLTKKVVKLDDVPETFRGLYIERDGAFIRADTAGEVELEGVTPNERVQEFRTNNTRLTEEKEALELKFKDVDLDKYRDLLSKEKDLEDHKLVKRGELDQVRRAAADEAVKPLQTELQKRETTISQLRTRLEEAVIGDQVVQAGLPLGLKKGAVLDIKMRASRIFKLNENGEVVAFEPDGKTPKFKNGVDPYTLEHFVQDLSQAADGKHLFEENSGGGGDSSKSGSQRSDNGYNPWDKKTFNRFEQGKILKADRPRGIRMAKIHGIIIPEREPGT